MGLLTSFAVFFIIWWVVLFVTLPFGVRGQWEDGKSAKGTEPGAPVKSKLGKKFLITTVIAIVVFIIFRIALSFGAFDSFILV
jgi:predicted secreted protein